MPIPIMRIFFSNQIHYSPLLPKPSILNSK